MENKDKENSRRIPLTGSGMLNGLSGIVNDLWGSVSAAVPVLTIDDHQEKTAAPEQKTVIPERRPVAVPEFDAEALLEESRRLSEQLAALTRDIENAPGLEIPTVINGVDSMEGLLNPVPKAAPQAEPVQPEAPAVPVFEKLWAVSDEQVDWTAAMTQSRQEDGIPAAVWAFYRENAEKVLGGDVPTYLKVIEKLQPLEDLLPFCEHMEAGAENAEQLTGSFLLKPESAGDDPDEVRRRLCGMALRVARDLLALLPAAEAVVDGEAAGMKIHVTFTREELRHARFNRLDPVEFSMECGASITK